MSIRPPKYVVDGSKKPQKSFLQKLQSYDSLLDVAFVKCDFTGRPIERWQVTRKSNVDGRPRHIMFVVGPGFSFQPLDNRVIEKLAKCDSTRYVSREGFMHALGMKTDEGDSYKEAWEEYEEQRYHANIEELADKMSHAMKNDPQTASSYSNEAEQLAVRRTEHDKEVQQAYADGEGVVVWDHDLGCGRMGK